ncbi:nucleotidyltransferase domain-containing protein [Actinokineospora bangkokensis]|uniref:Nucleotidyltransferase n=1 Tax=Actinokineospora bangkokensis TaxID=1193682 RepID=A0A1Q9LMS0_9PSEU|nr:nucleotidyltransferase [Actinokineospora bangkokensis]OLR93311.1 hypothetical protein BJP25_17705 [Actinokineospora bangkokensis]
MDEPSLLRTLTKVVTTLDAAGIEFAVAGGCAVYARGGPPSDHDVDVFVREDEVRAAQAALVEAGMRPVEPPEDWLTKVYDGDVLVDLVFRPNHRGVDALLERAEVMRIGSTRAKVLDGTDVLVDKLLVLGPHRCDFAPLLVIARDLREQVDWERVAVEVAESAYAKAFLVLLEELSVIEREGSPV